MVKWNDHVNIVQRTVQHGLIDAEQLALHVLIRLIVACLDLDRIVERVDVDGALRRLILNDGIDDLARHAREATVDVEAELEALAAIRQLKLPRDDFLEVFA